MAADFAIGFPIARDWIVLFTNRHRRSALRVFTNSKWVSVLSMGHRQMQINAYGYTKPSLLLSVSIRNVQFYVTFITFIKYYFELYHF